MHLVFIAHPGTSFTDESWGQVFKNDNPLPRKTVLLRFSFIATDATDTNVSFE